MALASGHKWEEMEPKKKEKYQKDITGFMNDMIVLKPGNYVVPKYYLKYQETIYNFKFRTGDVLIMTYPKCGTTWMQEIVWTMLNNPNLDNPEADIDGMARVPFLESDMLFPPMDPRAPDDLARKMMAKFQEICPGKSPADGVQLQLAAALPGRRTIKTHFPFSLLPPGLLDTVKVIFVVRNPKDACLSFQHHHRLFKGHNFVGTQDDFVDYFVNGDLLFSPFHGAVKEAWEKKDHPNMHFIAFEDLKADIDGELKKINKFIETGLNEQQLQNVKQQSSFGSMKAKDPYNSTNASSDSHVNMDIANKEGGFVRKGQAGGWKGKYTAEQEAKIDDYVKRNFAGTGLTFKY